ncbi:hypothetical protein PLESTB_001357900 [Pleodorina starrii]|uniref:Uncharacterized protein n=1 Tax=Pleodorina starrii TaxID=330485 RepID=A0A9W6BV62_9CHLO|nr:hypothetical protein PLESTM_001917700 [Pleodorina starrii]GLC58430.1 hypothetical protein PLESTB_001357900 [Pleodorina starrii]GLC76485.1 hypothetical protein PLESTF_001786300 [Pleodorina starrii]
MRIGTWPFLVNRTHRLNYFGPPRTVVSRASPRADACHTGRPRTLYGLLGIKRSATPAEIRAAYRSAARRLHPDTNPSPAAQEDFQRIKAAYEVLNDSRLRKVYDNLGLGALGPEFSDLGSYLAAGQQENVGSGAASGGRRRSGGGGGVRGRDVHLVLGLMLSEAAQGADKALSYEAMSACEECKGSGCATAPPPCPVCRGSGQILKSSYFGAEASGLYGGAKVMGLDTCPACAGTGQVRQPPCNSCGGRGRRLASRELTVRIPAGVERGQVLRVVGEGGAGRCGGAAGDLLVRLEVYPDPNLERRGYDLHSSLPVDVFVAVLGGAVAVDSVRGSRLLEVPPGSQPGDVLRLAGAGIVRAAPGGGGGILRGDHYFTLSVRLPSAGELCATSLELLTRLATIDTTMRRRGAGGRRRAGTEGGSQGTGPAAAGGPAGV